MTTIAKYAQDPITLIALEEGFFSNAVTALRSLLPKLSFSFREASDHLGAQDTNTIPELKVELSRRERKVLEHLNKLNFLNESLQLVMVPENFQGSLVAYLDLLTAISGSLYADTSKIISEYNTILGSFITNKGDKTSLNDHKVFYSRVANDRQELQKRLHTFFPVQTGKSKLPLKQIVNRFSDFEAIFKRAKLLADRNTPEMLRIVKDEIQKSNDLLAIIITQLKDGTLHTVSKESAVAIAKGADEIARWVETVSVFYYSTVVAITVANELATQFSPK